MPRLTHLDRKGRPKMVDVSKKDESVRTAVAESLIKLTAKAGTALKSKLTKKGDPLAVAIVAGIQAAKKTSDLIPLCHPIRIESVSIEPIYKARSVTFRVTCVTTDRTGIEMEAMTAAAVAALAFYDMVKSVDHGIEIAHVRLLKKTGGRSGTYTARSTNRKK